MHSASTTGDTGLSRDELRHYSRHIIIPEIGIEGQRRLKAARVLLIGTGGLGSPAAQYLAAAGVGTIGLVDFDVVDASNLQRQVLYTADDVGRAKLDCAAARLSAMNPHIRVIAHAARLDTGNALDLIGGYDLVVDGTDNFATRYLVNDACVLLGKPNVYASVFRFEGLLSVFNYLGGPCYRCLYPEAPPDGFAPSCAEGGVLGVLPGMLGTMQAAEAIKLITGTGTPMAGRLLRLDAAGMNFREFTVRKNPRCHLCGEHPTLTGLSEYNAACHTATHADTGPAVTRVSPAWLQQRLAACAPLQLVDVRNAGEYALVSIDGAQLIPLDEIDTAASRLDRMLPTVCYCKSGVRSERAARTLAAQGFVNVMSLEGGITAWAQAVDPSALVY